jgi:hypothetical protein
MSQFKFMTPSELLKVRLEIEQLEEIVGTSCSSQDCAPQLMEHCKTLLKELEQAASRLSELHEPGETDHLNPGEREKKRRMWLAYAQAAELGRVMKKPNSRR